MSSALLYLAIVAIWAVFLVPAWLKKPHGHRDRGADRRHADETVADDRTLVDDRAAAGDIKAADTPARADGTQAGPRPGAAAADHRPVSWSHPGQRGEFSSRDAGPSDDQRAEVPDLQAGRPAPASIASSADPQARDRMLRARRLILLILVLLTAVPVIAANTGMIGWWVCIPPSGMLALYLLLLREVAIADAELARARLERQVLAARRRAASGERDAEASQPIATIIDISQRVGDQLYDQYADTAARAVGD